MSKGFETVDADDDDDGQSAKPIHEFVPTPFLALGRWIPIYMFVRRQTDPFRCLADAFVGVGIQETLS